MYLGLQSGGAKNSAIRVHWFESGAHCSQGLPAGIWGSLQSGSTVWNLGFTAYCLWPHMPGFWVLDGFGDRPTSESTHHVVSICTLNKFTGVYLLCETGTVIPSSSGDGEN